MCAMLKSEKHIAPPTTASERGVLDSQMNEIK